MATSKFQLNLTSLCVSLLLLHIFRCCSSQKTCPNCGSMQVPYPLSTSPNCGDSDYYVRCDNHSQKLYFDALNGSSYLILRIVASAHRMVVLPSPWLHQTCITMDMQESEGLWLNQTLPFNITSSNTIFLFNCSPRLLVSPLNCTQSSLCHRYLESSGHVDEERAHECASGPKPCCTFLAGGMPSAYKIRLHASGCKAFRSILNLNAGKPASQWEEGLEIQWAPPPEPPCKSQADCAGPSTCSPKGKTGTFHCLCNRGYSWDSSSGTCLKNKKTSNSSFIIEVSIPVAAFLVFAVVIGAITLRKSSRFSDRMKLAEARAKMLKSSNGEKSARMFSIKELKNATDGFSKCRILGSGGFGEVYKGQLQDGTTVAIKSAKVGNMKSTEQVLNEVRILSQVNHKNLVRLLGCCIEAEQPLMIYEYIPNGTLHDHLQGKFSTSLNWKARLRIALQTAEALAYLHSSAYTPIYHRDIKSTNVLLDEDLNAKVADFGLSRLASPGLSHVSTCAQGTLGYLDPEYYRNYQLTDKSDVYSFGVVLLELLTSQKAVDFSRDEDHVNLAIYVNQKASSGLIMEVVDKELLEKKAPFSSLKAFAELALACLRDKKGERPSMTDVVQELKHITEMVNQEEEGCNEANIIVL